LEAGDFFVAPGGSPFGPGTVSQPYDLVTALSGLAGGPGDTFWLRGGDYMLGHLNTTVHGDPGNPITFRSAPGEAARIDGSLSIFNSIGHVVFRDFELYRSDTNRVSAQTGVGFNVTDISIIPGIACYAPNLSFINLVVRDQTRHAIYTDHLATNILVYGCILFNNGWRSPDNAEGHGIYAQGSVGTRTMTENIVFNNSGCNLHVYENSPNHRLVGVTLDGNVAFNAGAIQDVRDYRDWIVGVDFPAEYADEIILTNNMSYRLPDLSTQSEAQIGRDATNGTLVLADNYLPLGLLVNNWSNATVTGNLLAPRLMASYVVSLLQAVSPLSVSWDNNTYVSPPAGNQTLLNLTPYSFSEWQTATGFDLDTTFVIGDLEGTRIFVSSNQYEAGRANIIIYNWDNLDQVAVDVSSVLPVGWGFEVRNAQNWHAAPALVGVYSGQPLQLPMTNLTVAVPNGQMVTPPPTGPTFNVFVLLPRPGKLEVRPVGGGIQVSWPAGLGGNSLQASDNLIGGPGWSSVTNVPVVAGNQCMITEPAGSGPRFYRLQPGQ